MSWAALVAKNKDVPAPESKPQLVRSKELHNDKIKTAESVKEEEAKGDEPGVKKEKKYGDKRILVLDTGALIRGAGGLATQADEFTTTADVLAEVRDKKTRAFVDSFPFEIVLREPSKESARAVIEVAKATGDFGTLSRTDLRVIALAHTLASENHEVQPPDLRGPDGMKASPVINKSKPGTSAAASIPSLPGWGSWGGAANEENEEEKEEAEEEEGEEEDGAEQGGDESEPKEETAGFHAEEGEAEDVEDAEEVDGGWITPANIHTYGGGQDAFTDEDNRKIGCMTTDFAMQNVLLHAGVLLVSVQGFRVKYLKKWILRCFACYYLVKDTTRQFCPSCGSGDTLKRVSYSVNDKGEDEIWINPKRRINVKGTVYRLPKPRGGRKGTNKTVILREDQLPNCGRKGRSSGDREAEHIASLLSDDWMFAGDKRDRKGNHPNTYNTKTPYRGRRRKA